MCNFFTKILCNAFIFFCLVLVGIALWSYRTSLLGIDIFFVPSNSMAPTLLPGQFILVDTHRYQTKSPQMGEVVVFKHPSENNPIWLVKRLAPWPQGVYRDPDKPWYVLGDNALHSHDSRYFGGVKTVYAPVTHVLFRWNGENIECPCFQAVE